VTRITSAPILAYPDYNEPFVLHTDASQEGLGAVLYQEQNSEMRVIGYGSRSLTPAEKNYEKTKMGGVRTVSRLFILCQVVHNIYGQ
jgi:hypothetical protein